MFYPQSAWLVSLLFFLFKISVLCSICHQFGLPQSLHQLLLMFFFPLTSLPSYLPLSLFCVCDGLIDYYSALLYQTLVSIFYSVGRFSPDTEEHDREKMAPSTRCKENSDEQSRDPSTDKARPKESREKYRGRARTRKWSSASSGSSSSRSPSSCSTSSGSSSGSSSPSASSRSGRSSTSCSSSSSSSSSPGSLKPSWHRRGKRQRSRSKQPERDEKEGRRHSPSPKPTKLHIARLTRNVTKDHIREIFSTFGKVRVIDMPVERMHPGLSDAYVEFETPDGAEKALKHMDGGQIDGQEIRATAVPPLRRLSPRRRMRSPPPRWRRSPSQRRRRSPSPWLRSQKRWRHRFPRRPLHRSRSSSSSSWGQQLRLVPGQQSSRCSGVGSCL